MSISVPPADRPPPAGAHAGMAALEALLDAQALARLRELDPGDRNGLLLRVLRTYDGSLQRLRAQTIEARAQGDAEALRQAAHTLKSSSASIGALRLARLCERIEADSRHAPVETMVPLLDAMVAECDVLLAALRPLSE